MSDGKRRMNTKKKFVADGVFQAELNEFLGRALAKEGYAGIEVRVTQTATEIRIRSTKTTDLLKEGSRKVRELTSLIQKRFNYNNEDNKVELILKQMPNRNMSSAAQAENIKLKLLRGIPVRMAANGVINLVVKRGGAKGVEVIISGKLRGQRAKSQKYKAGYMISTGQPKLEFIDEAHRHVQLRQGVVGVKVKIMHAVDPRFKGAKTMPDEVTVYEPKGHEGEVDPGVLSFSKQEQQ
jgi:small subunit ribosomal protein S3e